MSDPMLYKMAKQRARLWMSRFRRDSQALLAFMFHAVVQDRDELERQLIDPALCITLPDFRQFVQYYQANGYQFVSPDDVASGLPVDGRYVLVTFDDGYFNNRLALPVLQEFQVPAVFFISTAYIESGKSYWWDVIYRQRAAAATPPRKIAEEIESVKSLHFTEIEPYLTRQFGVSALDPRCDADRPFGPNELAEFNRQPLVHLGNHTRNHAILTKLSIAEARSEIAMGQADLERLCGVSAQSIAYPNGAHDASVHQAAEEAGLVLGMTVEKRKNYLPPDSRPQSLLDLGRLQIFCDRPLIQQLEIFRGDLSRRSRTRRRGQPRQTA